MVQYPVTQNPVQQYTPPATEHGTSHSVLAGTLLYHFDDAMNISFKSPRRTSPVAHNSLHLLGQVSC